jgi:hypothetical protein
MQHRCKGFFSRFPPLRDDYMSHSAERQAFFRNEPQSSHGTFV